VQQLACSPTGTTGRATIKMPSQLTATSMMSLAGSQNQLTDCIINGQNNLNLQECIDVTSSAASASAPHTMTNLDISQCNGFAAIVFETNAINIKLQNSSIHDNASFTIVIDSGSNPQINNNVFSNNASDLECQDHNPGPDGAGNTGIVSCQKCFACPF
jgi:hypothetical protein